jgi:hypothetical protein
MRSEHAYIAGAASIGLSIMAWAISMRTEQAGMARADRWGIFVGEWAPTFIALGNGLRTYELEEQVKEQMQELRPGHEPAEKVGR